MLDRHVTLAQAVASVVPRDPRTYQAAELAVLVLVAKSGVAMHEVHEWLGLAQATAAGWVDRAEIAGLVERVPQPSGRVIVMITPRGARIVRRTRAWRTE